MSQRLICRLAIVCALCSLGFTQLIAQAPGVVTVIITLRSQGAPTIRTELAAALADSRDHHRDPIAADRARAVAVGRALSQIEAETVHERATLEKAISDNGGTVIGAVRSHNLVIARVRSDAIVGLRALPSVAAVDLDQSMPALLDVATATMGVQAFWNAGLTGGSTDVAVVDSGLYVGHPAFAGRSASVFCAVFHTAAQLQPLYMDVPSDCDDFAGHGTKVTGMVFSQGTPSFPTRRGTAFGIDRLYNLKAAFNEAPGGTASVLLSDAFTAVATAMSELDPPEVINYSYGGTAVADDSTVGRFFDGLVDTFSTTVTVSAGNSGPNALTLVDSASAYNAIVVANVNDQGTPDRVGDAVHLTSSRGPTLGGRRKPDLSAPGTGIFSTSTLGGFEQVTGTSYSSPAVAGAAALLIHAGVADAKAVKAVMINSADDYGTPGWDSAYGWGYYNGAAAFAQRAQVFLQTLAPPSSPQAVRFYERNTSAATKASLVWNRKVNYVGATAPAGWSLNNLDLRLYSRDADTLRAQSVSSIDNVEQVVSTTPEAAVLVAESTGSFTGVSEPFALAHSGGFVERSGPGISVTVNAPANVAAGATFTVTAQATNAGDVVGHQYQLTLVVPAGFAIISGANPQALGSAAPGVATSASWTVSGPSTPTGVAGSMSVNGSTTSYGWIWSNSGSAAVTVAGTGTAGDTDGDGLPNSWESTFGLNAASATGLDGASGDPDNDGLTNAQEFAAGTHPRGFYRRYLAEGAINSFFDVRLALLNVGATTTTLQLRFLQPGGTVVSRVEQLAPGRRRTLTRTDFSTLTSPDFSTVLESDQPVVLDRTMSWDGSGYGSHAETGVLTPSKTWYLAEGSTSGVFSLFYLLQNPNSVSVSATVRYLLPFGQSPIVQSYTLPAFSRTTIPVDDQGVTLANTDVSAVISSSEPIVAERAMYRSTPTQSFAAGHESAGVTSAALSWFLAEGATGPFFDCFILLANPNTQAASVSVEYLLSDGTTRSKGYAVPAEGRFTIFVDDEEIPVGSGLKPLDNVAVSTTLTSNVPIIVERTMWWPSPASSPNFWTEAHNSPGATQTGTRWGLAEGEVGGSLSAETYILVANTSAFAGQARVTLYFEDGTNAVRTIGLAAKSRTNVNVSVDFPQAAGKRFGAVVESLGTTPAEIVVERAMYTSPGGVTWAAGTNALATRLP